MRILLVDDDTSVLQGLLAVLKSLPGHELRAATSGEKAIENAATLGGLDLLITDVVMDPMDGFALREQLAAQYPGLRTIFISGYDLSEYAERIGQNTLLQKPVTPEALAEAVQRAATPPAPVAVAQPVATPRQPTATPRAVARASAPAPQAPVSPAAPTVSASAPAASLEAQAGAESASPATADFGSSPSLIGHTVGGYHIVSQLGEGRWGSIYAAVQTAINRPVGLKILNPVKAQSETQKQRFIADARSKAHVQHPAILAVYEAGSADGYIFYTQEFVDGQSLAEMALGGRTIDELAALKILRTIADGLLYFDRNHTPHSALDASDIYLSTDGHPRLTNLATQLADQQPTVEYEVKTLGRAVRDLLPPGPGVSGGLRALLGRTQQGGQNGISAWGPLLQGVKALEPKFVPVEAEKITAQDHAAEVAVAKARAQQKRAFLINVASMISLIIFAGWAVWYFLIKSNERFLNEQVAIPAGEFIFGDGQTAKTEAFWIDKHEVTWGEYAQFVTWIEKSPDAEHDFDHPRTPKRDSHIPPNWRIYYENAKAGKAAHKTPIDLNCPVLEVTWWNAYAFAKWRGRELPTEVEWEKAARGTEGFAFPWGEKADSSRANTGTDYVYSKPDAKGKVDGFNYWSPVDGLTTDKSPYGVIGTAGNVSEWTATWTKDDKFPVIKGGNFSRAPMGVADRIADHPPGKIEEFIGFRTISRKAPK